MIGDGPYLVQYLCQGGFLPVLVSPGRPLVLVVKRPFPVPPLPWHGLPSPHQAQPAWNPAEEGGVGKLLEHSGAN